MRELLSYANLLSHRMGQDDEPCVTYRTLDLCGVHGCGFSAQ